MKKIVTLGILFALFAGTAAVRAADDSPRRVLSLDGVWQIAEGKMEAAPTVFARTVPVPGLVSLAIPAFDPAPGPKVANRLDPDPATVDPAREAFWYRRTFHLNGPVPAVARLKVFKAMFGTRVILNGRMLGDHAPNATPGWFDVRAALKPGENELLLRVGASLAAVPRGVPNLHDDEKDRYIPGIFDSVELILSGTPHFLHVQTAPDINRGAVRVQATLRNDGAPARTAVDFVVREAKSGRIAGRITSQPADFATGTETTVDVTVPLADCRLWSPEDPFLYRLEADSGADRFSTRFGMREFKFDPVTRRALLNGKPYFLRGSNITLYRFFEDPDCGDLPWSADWVRLLHQRVKDMHWNSLRYCIGFPPEAWYELADEMGILIQDEFPIWRIGGTARDELAREYAQWMRERWNHPCVIIWDAQNETHTPMTGEALTLVRHLDLSDRPWDNGWGLPQKNTDVYESHPYHFSLPGAVLADLAGMESLPRGPIPYDRQRAAIVNEYGWLWLNRDGSPTTLTSRLYRNLVGEDASVDKRRHLSATWLAADTEFWRHGRNLAGLMHFTTLGYSRSDGQTSDHWSDIRTLEWEPEFHRYVRDAFAPVSPMVDYWSGTGIAGRPLHLSVRLLNDLEQPWSGAVTLRLRRADGGSALYEQAQDARLVPHGQGRVEFALNWPATAGDYVLEAGLAGADGKPVHSVRDIRIHDAASLGLAFARPVFASSSWVPPQGSEAKLNPWTAREAPAANAVDGDPSTYWASDAIDPSWLAVDLGASRRISRVHIFWGVENALTFKVEVSADARTWTEVAAVAANVTTQSELRFAPIDARYVRVVGLKRQPAAPGGWPAAHEHYSIRELQVFE